jgi:DNA invertase Pin-like site-specific DNA recombinase
MNVCHKCDYPPCIRPDHLFIGTQKDNIADAIAKGRLNAQWERYSRIYIGEGNPAAKISPADARTIFALLRFGWPQRLVAKMFSISKTQVARIGSRMSWKSIQF